MSLLDHLYRPCLVWKTDLPLTDGDNYRESPVLSLHGCEWRLTLERNWNERNEEETWNLYLRNLQPADGEPKPVNVSIYMGCSNKLKRMDALTCTFPESSAELILWFGRSLLQQEYSNVSTYDGEQRNTPTNDKLTFCCFFKFDKKTREHVTRPKMEPLVKEIKEGNKSLESLPLDLHQALPKYEECSKGEGRKYFSLQEALSSSSEGAEAIIETKISTEEVDIAHLQPTRQELALANSSGVDALTMDNAFDLYQAAHKYAVMSLRKKCASFLEANLNKDTVCKVLLLAHTFQDNELADVAISFIVKKDRFFFSPQWKSFARDHPDIKVKVYKEHVKTIF